jgi:hypothetical protein
MKAAFIATLVMTMLATPIHANDFLSGVVQGAIGCPAAGGLHRGAELLRAGDSLAKALAKLHCRGIPDGTAVVVENISPADYEVCVRPAGATDECLWIYRSTLTLKH